MSLLKVMQDLAGSGEAGHVGADELIYGLLLSFVGDKPDAEDIRQIVGLHKRTYGSDAWATNRGQLRFWLLPYQYHQLLGLLELLMDMPLDRVNPVVVRGLYEILATQGGVKVTVQDLLA